MDTTQTERALDLRPGSRGRGRKSHDGGEETPDCDAINKSKADLMKLFKRMELAAADYNAQCKGVAEKAKVNTVTVKKLIKASATGKFKDVQRILDQQAVVFELVGEVQGGTSTVN